jgi:tyrosyl-tRNA synthetase
MSGHELVSKVTKKQVFGVTLPLITNEEGNKFGKSAGNAVWLDSKKTSEFSFYQFFIRMPDSEVEKLLRLLTFLPLNEVNDIMEVHKRTPELKTAQKRLARELTMLIHGKEGLENAEKISMALYSGDINTLGELEPQEVSRIFEGAAYKEILMEPGTTILDAALKAKCFLAEKDAVRIIVSGGFYVNQKRTSNISEIFTNGVHILKNGISILRVGKKNYYIVKWV